MFSFISIWKLGHALSLMSSCNCRWSCSIVVYLSWSVLVRASKLTEWVSAAWKKIVEASFRSQESNDCGERQAVLANKHSLAIFGEQTSIADQLCITEEPHSTQQTWLLVSFKDSCKKCCITNNLNDMGRVRVHVVWKVTWWFLDGRVTLTIKNIEEYFNTFEFIVYFYLKISFLLMPESDMGFPAGASGKEPGCQCRWHKRCGLDS